MITQDGVMVAQKTHALQDGRFNSSSCDNIQGNKNINMKRLDVNLFDGYISELDDGVFISHISAKHKGRGDFSKLLIDLKNRFNWIKVPTPSKQMFDILIKKGFIHRVELFPEPFNCPGDIMYWKKEVINNDT